MESCIIVCVGRVPDIEHDKRLVARAKADPNAFGEIFDTYYEPILGYVVKRVGDVDVAQDIVAETFLKAMRGLKFFAWRGVPLSAWLYRIAGNELAMYMRGRKRSGISLELLVTDGFDPASEVFVEEKILLADVAADDAQAKAVREALQTLPFKYQEIIALRYFGNKKTADIATIVGKKEGTVRSLLSRGLAFLGEKLRGRAQQKAESRITGIEGAGQLPAQPQNLL